VRSRRIPIVSITVPALVCVGLVVAILILRATPERRYARMLASAQSLDHRPIEARIVGLPYAPYVLSHADSRPHRSTKTLAFRGVVGEFLQIAANDEGHLHERGVAMLTTGSPAEAVQLLEVAARRSPGDSAIAADLAAARLAAAAVSDDMQLFASALAASDAALRIDPGSPEARFNRALALDRLRLHEAAAAAYRHYLEVDATSRWSDEARRNLAHCTYETESSVWQRMRNRLEGSAPVPPDFVARAVSAFPQDSRAWAELVCLSAWADKVRSGRFEEADQKLALARDIGATLHSQSGESLLADTVAAIDRADAHTRDLLVKAYAEYMEGRLLIRARRVAEAKLKLEVSRRLFQSANSPMALVAQYYIANTAMDSGDDEQAWHLFSTIRRQAPDRYASLTAQRAWQEGVVLARGGRVHESLDRTLSAVAGFARLGERLYQSEAENSAAATLSFLGRPADAWKLRRTIFESVSRSGDDILFEHALNTAARCELREQHPDVAEALIEVEMTRKTTSPRLRLDALLCRLQAMPTNDIVACAGTLRQAASNIADPSLREEALDDIRLAEASAVRERNPALATQLTSQTIAFRAARANALALPAAYVERARALRLLRREDEAITDLEWAVRAIEQERQTITRDDLRDSFGWNTATAYRELFDIRAERGEYGEAFAVTERGRAYRIVEQLTRSNVAGVAPPRTAEEMRTRIPRGVVVVELSALSNRTVILALDSRGLRPYVVKVPAEQIASERDALLGAIARRDASATDTAATRLYDRLIAPMASQLASVEELVIVPDEETTAIPFAALKNSLTNRYLVEDFVLTVAPSAATYAQTMSRAHPPDGTGALVVGDPAFEQTLFPDLERLPQAEREARQIAAMYPGVNIRLGTAASRSSVVAALESVDVVDIASHAVANERDSSLSAILLAAGADGDSLLYVRDIAALHLTRAPVVILAGCHTASTGRNAASVGSLATAFLAAGARTVIGTLWNVDDDIAADTSIALHGAMKRGEPPSAALRNVQLQMLLSSDERIRSTQSWSNIQSYGSGR
jgi:CHAT domain-containing protein